MSDFNTMVIEEFRANGGVVTEAAPFGDSLVVLHATGARSGRERLTPLVSPVIDGKRVLVASKAGAPDNPDWYYNLLAHPDITVETGDGTAISSAEVSAVDLKGAERDSAWERFKAASDGFREYEERTDRVIPVLRLARR